MSDLRFITGEIPSNEDLVDLYASVGWTTYTEDTARLEQAFRASSYVLAAYDGEQLVGVLRSLSDGVSIHYLQDVLVAPNRQRAGIGKELVRRALAEHSKVRAHMLMTDDRPEQLAFYRELGFTRTDEHDPRLNTFVRFGSTNS